jgi:hypothetical protein
MTRGRMSLPGVKGSAAAAPKRGEPFRPHYASRSPSVPLLTS